MEWPGSRERRKSRALDRFYAVCLVLAGALAVVYWAYLL